MPDIVIDRVKGMHLGIDSSLLGAGYMQEITNFESTNGKPTVRKASDLINSEIASLGQPTAMARVVVGNDPVTLVAAAGNLYFLKEDDDTLIELLIGTDPNNDHADLVAIEDEGKFVPIRIQQYAGRVFVTDGTIMYEIVSVTIDGTDTWVENALTELSGWVDPPRAYYYGNIQKQFYTPVTGDTWTASVVGDLLPVFNTDSFKVNVFELHNTTTYIYLDETLTVTDLSHYTKAYLTVKTWSSFIHDGSGDEFVPSHWQFGLQAADDTWYWTAMTTPDNYVCTIWLDFMERSLRETVKSFGYRYVGPGADTHHFVWIGQIKLGGGIEGTREYYFIRDQGTLGKTSLPQKTSGTGYGLGYLIVDFADGGIPNFRVSATDMLDGDTINIYRTVAGIPYKLEQNIIVEELGVTSYTKDVAGCVVTLEADHHYEDSDQVVFTGATNANAATEIDLPAGYFVKTIVGEPRKITLYEDNSLLVPIDSSGWDDLTGTCVCNPLSWVLLDYEWDDVISTNEYLDTLLTTIPSARAMAIWRGCLWLGGCQRYTDSTTVADEPLMLYKSELNIPTNFSTNQLPSREVDAMRITLDPSTSTGELSKQDRIMQILALPEPYINELLVFTKKAVYGVRGNDASNFVVHEISPYGIMSGSGVTVTPQGVWWVSRDGLVTYPGAQVQAEISTFIKDNPSSHGFCFYAGRKFYYYANSTEGDDYRLAPAIIYDFDSGGWHYKDTSSCYAMCRLDLPDDMGDVLTSDLERFGGIAVLDSSERRELAQQTNLIPSSITTPWYFSGSGRKYTLERVYLAIYCPDEGSGTISVIGDGGAIPPSPHRAARLTIDTHGILDGGYILIENGDVALNGLHSNYSVIDANNIDYTYPFHEADIDAMVAGGTATWVQKLTVSAYKDRDLTTPMATEDYYLKPGMNPIDMAVQAQGERCSDFCVKLSGNFAPGTILMVLRMTYSDQGNFTVRA